MTSSLPPELAAIPPCLRRTRTPQRTPARRALAWLAFAALYIALPLALVAGIYSLNTMANTTADRADAFYQQTQASYNVQTP